jgi:hypothetical protein
MGEHIKMNGTDNSQGANKKLKHNFNKKTRMEEITQKSWLKV